MADIVLMPQLGISEESAVLAKWIVKKGDEVKAGTRLFTLETGKASFEVESEFSGIVLEILCGEGDELPIKAPVCVIGKPGESFELPGTAAKTATKTDENATKTDENATKTDGNATKTGENATKTDVNEINAEKTATKEENNKTNTTEFETNASGSETRTYRNGNGASGFKAGAYKNGNETTGLGNAAGETHAASPRARALAKKAHVELSNVSASGPEGRIIERDVKAYLDAGRPVSEQAKTAAPASADYTEKPFTRMRKVIAENMKASLANTAQLTLNSSFDATSLLGFRKLAKSGVIKGFENVTIGDLVLFAVSRTLLDFPYMNAHCLGDKTREFSTVNLAVACDTPRGLMVPVIWHAEKLTLPEISKKVKELAAACNAGTVLPDDLTGGSFTVTNLGNLGIESFTPVINPPQTGILGVDCPTTRLKEKDGQLSVYTAMGLSLTFDHRAVDGAPAARFLKALGEKLENIQSIIDTGRNA